MTGRSRSTMVKDGLAAAVMTATLVSLVALVAAQRPAPPSGPPPQLSAGSPDALLGQALHQEEIEGNLQAAIATYQKVLKAPGVPRAVAARAQFRIGACYERLGAGEARKAYETVLAKYGDQEAAVREARVRLAAMGRGAAAVVPTAGSGPNLRMLWGKVDWWGARISPDGRQVAFIDMATANLWVRDIATATDRNLTNTPKEKEWIDFPLYFSWSHDGTRLAYDWYTESASEIRAVDVKTGAVTKFETTRTLSSGRSNPSAFSSPDDWSPDDSRILVTIGLSSDQCRLGWLSVKDGTVTELKAARGESLGHATVSADGAFIAYAARRAGPGDLDVYIAPSDGSSTRVLVSGPDADVPVAWTPDGTGLIYEGRRSGVDGLWVVRLSGGKAVGEPVAVPGVGRIHAQGLTRSGALLYATGGQGADLWVATVDLAAGKTLDQKMLDVPGGSAAYSMGSYSPDGALMTYDVRVGNRASLVLARVDGGQPRLFTPPFQIWSSVPPTWSADSKSVVRYGTTEPSMRTLFRTDAQTGASEQVFPPVKADTRAPGDRVSYMLGLSADGRTVYYQKNNGDTRRSSIWSRDLTAGEERELFRTDKPAGISPGVLSPDRRRLLFTLNQDGALRELRTLSLDDGRMTTICTPAGVVMTSAWSPDARHIVYVQPGRTDAAGNSSAELWVVDADGGQPRSLGIVHPIIRGVAVHPDGKHIAYVTTTRANQEEWLLENFLPPAKTGATRK